MNLHFETAIFGFFHGGSSIVFITFVITVTENRIPLNPALKVYKANNPAMLVSFDCKYNSFLFHEVSQVITHRSFQVVGTNLKNLSYSAAQEIYGIAVQHNFWSLSIEISTLG